MSNGDRLRPIVILKLTDKSAKKISIRLHPCAPAEAFRDGRFLPRKSNIRTQWYRGQGEDDGKFSCITRLPYQVKTQYL